MKQYNYKLIYETRRVPYTSRAASRPVRRVTVKTAAEVSAFSSTWLQVRRAEEKPGLFAISPLPRRQTRKKTWEIYSRAAFKQVMVRRR
ncbi:hypothetical protein Q8A67_005925 [Cirrhinus molitorella]|uniref:Uncharacterized protein n=1 Tax=Cirrhinus molitorella TaxID=172907 RepID=A0AA88TVU7_9TELE|nr:hypothetical protein Q8A67_005925 [Cirrhinus molitorella]